MASLHGCSGVRARGPWNMALRSCVRALSSYEARHLGLEAYRGHGARRLARAAMMRGGTLYMCVATKEKYTLYSKVRV